MFLWVMLGAIIILAFIMGGNASGQDPLDEDQHNEQHSHDEYIYDENGVIVGWYEVDD